MSESGNQATRLFFLYNYLIKNASKEHTVSRLEMVEALSEKEFKETTHRNFLYDMDALRTQPFCLDLRYDSKSHGWYVANPPFELNELKLMIDSVQSSKFITQKTADDISRKIRSLVGERQQQELNRTAFVAERVKSMNDSAVKEADRIHEAIYSNRKIQFRYFHRSPTRTKERKYSKNGEPYIVSPFATVWDSGNYYLYAFDGKKFRTFRIDRMEKIKIHPDKREGIDEYRKTDLTARKATVFGMYRGEAERITFLCQNTIADSMIDKFGEGINFAAVDEGHFRFSADVELSPPFYAWVATFGKKIRIESPQRAIDGMMKFLDDSSSMYLKDDKKTLKDDER